MLAIAEASLTASVEIATCDRVKSGGSSTLSQTPLYIPTAIMILRLLRLY